MVFIQSSQISSLKFSPTTLHSPCEQSCRRLPVNLAFGTFLITELDFSQVAALHASHPHDQRSNMASPIENYKFCSSSSASLFFQPPDPQRERVRGRWGELPSTFCRHDRATRRTMRNEVCKDSFLGVSKLPGPKPWSLIFNDG